MTQASPETISFFAGFLQFNVQKGNIAENLAKVREGLAVIAADNSGITPGIIVLPELWATDFAYEKIPILAERIPGLLQELQGLSEQYQVLLAGSLPQKLQDRYYNTLFVTGPEGVAGAYQKQRLFNPMAEDSFFSPGQEAPAPIQTQLGPVAGLVCYDLRFPELLRDQAGLGTRLLAVSAQWPTARLNHWRILIQARAIENQIFVVAANRCGLSDETVFGGHSMIVGPDGTILLEAGDGEEFKGTMLDTAQVLSARSMFVSVPEK